MKTFSGGMNQFLQCERVWERVLVSYVMKSFSKNIVLKFACDKLFQDVRK
jgi:hypothetical protein